MAFEAVGVKLAGADAEAIAGRCGDQRVGVLERLAQACDVDLNGLDRAGRRVLAPQRDRQTLSTHWVVGVQREHRDNRARSGAAELDLTAVGAYLERPEEPEFEHWRDVTRSVPVDGTERRSGDAARWLPGAVAGGVGGRDRSFADDGHAVGERVGALSGRGDLGDGHGGRAPGGD